jgi:hypothetical protein
MHTGMSYSNKRLKTEAYYASVKEKAATAPSASSDNSGKSVSSHLHWKDDFSHMINKMRFKYSTQPKTVSEGLKYDSISKGKIASQTGNMAFECYFIYCC